MKVLFLDVDGVLNRFNPEHSGNLEDDLIDNLLRVIKETGCSIVLSSTWKFSKRYFLKFRENVVSKFPEGCFVGCTPTIIPQGRREKEIRLWLENNQHIDNWLVVDDYDFELTSMLDHCVITDALYGLTTEKANECIRRLNNGVNSGKV